MMDEICELIQVSGDKIIMNDSITEHDVDYFVYSYFLNDGHICEKYCSDYLVNETWRPLVMICDTLIGMYDVLPPALDPTDFFC